MELKTEDKDQILFINIKGSIDASNSKELEEFFQEKQEIGYRLFLLSFQEVEFISSGGISLLLKLQKEYSKKNCHLVGFGENSEIQILFSFLGIYKIWKFFPDLSSAKSYLENFRKELSSSATSPVRDTIKISLKKPGPVRMYFQKPGNPYQEETQIKTSKMEPVPETPLSEVNQKEKSDSILEKSPLQVSYGQPLDEELLEAKLTSLRKEFLESKEEIKSLFAEKNKIQFYKIPNIQDSISSLKKKASNTDESSKAEETNPSQVPSEKEIYCESCNSSLLVSAPGKYMCPNCNSQFLFRDSGNVTPLEKLA